MPAESYNIGCYLLDRIVELGCGHLFGVPGDYNLRFLDDVEAQKGLQWIGCANELNAAYAADGYARIRGFAAVMTTYGVGELSAVNGIAGAYAESNAVLHIVGGPSTAAAAGKKLLHHTLCDGNFTHFIRMSEEISCAVADLTMDAPTADIDRVLAEILYHRRPGYILLPLDVAAMPAEPPAQPLARRQPAVNEESVKAFTAAVEGHFQAAKAPAVMVGHLCERFGSARAAERLVREAHLPYVDMLISKGVVSERESTFVGTYYGGATCASVKKVVEEADVLVMLGVIFHDFGTSRFTHKIDSARTIDIQPFSAFVGGKEFAEVPMAQAIEAVHTAAVRHAAAWPSVYVKPPVFCDPLSDKYGGRHLWREIEAGLAPGDIIAVDQGTSTLSCPTLHFRENTALVFQCLWGSIGFSLPAAFGAQLADTSRRVILIIGDGAAQMSVQEIGSFPRYDLHPVIIMLNNKGYVVEKMIHGWTAAYNDIAIWDWPPIVKGMCADKASEVIVVEESGTALNVLQKTQSTRDKLYFLDVQLDSHELPAPARDEASTDNPQGPPQAQRV